MTVAGLSHMVVLMAVLVSAAGIQDLLSRRISNLFPVFIVLLFLVASTIAGWRIDVWQNLASFLLILTVGSFLFQRGVLGGGDVKLWAAVALWFKLPQLPVLILYIALTGGVLALVSILKRFFTRPDKSADGSNISSLKRARSVPYGVAIAFGTIVTITVTGAGLTGSKERSPAYEKLNTSLMNMVTE